VGKYAAWRMYDMGDISADQIRTDDSDAKATSQMIMRLIRLSHFCLDHASSIKLVFAVFHGRSSIPIIRDASRTFNLSVCNPHLRL